jgi:3-oxoadipate enol-lactonase
MTRAAAIPDGRISYAVDGDSRFPPLLLSHALGTTRDLWNPQLPALARRHRVVRYDTRGHGRSSSPTGEYTIAQLGADALAVMDDAGIDRADVCGLSLGGLTAIWLAQHAPGRVRKIVLANTAARIGTVSFWQDRIALVRDRGLGPVAESAPERWFTGEYRRTHQDQIAWCQGMLLQGSASGYAGCAAALRDADLRPGLPGIKTPALVIVGRFDPVTTAADGVELSTGIPGAKRVELRASHFSNLETAEEFTSTTSEFLAGR